MAVVETDACYPVRDASGSGVCLRNRANEAGAEPDDGLGIVGEMAFVGVFLRNALPGHHERHRRGSRGISKLARKPGLAAHAIAPNPSNPMNRRPPTRF